MAYKNKSIGDIQKVWPTVPKDYDRGWNLVTSQEWILEPGTPPMAIIGTEATATCRVTMKSSGTRGDTETKRIVEVKLRKHSGGWEILSSTAKGTWK